MPYQQISHIAIVLANSELVNLQRVHWIFLYRDAAAGDGEGVFLKHITLRAVAAYQTSYMYMTPSHTASSPLPQANRLLAAAR